MKLAAAKKAGVDVDKAEIARYHQKTREGFEAASSAVFASSRLWDDGVIEPEETRQTIALALEIVANAPQRPTRYGVFRM